MPFFSALWFAKVVVKSGELMGLMKRCFDISSEVFNVVELLTRLESSTTPLKTAE